MFNFDGVGLRIASKLSPTAIRAPGAWIEHRSHTQPELPGMPGDQVPQG